MNLKNLRQLLATIMSERAPRSMRHVTPSEPAALVEQCVAAASKPDDAWTDQEAELILAGYRSLDETARLEFLVKLAGVLNPSPEDIHSAVHRFLQHPEPDAVRRLHGVTTPPRHLLFSRLNEAGDGTANLVAMRATILAALETHQDLAPLEADLRGLLAGWFNRAFLVLQRIEWSSPANVLMRIIDYEAVHAIRDWNDLRSRIDPPDRACFALFHPLLAEDPLIFVEVALTQGVPGSIGELLAGSRQALDPQEADCAVFYSISNCQAGLRGISFGDMLIRQVIGEVAVSAPNIHTFVTLSPMPGFARWARKQAERGDPDALGLWSGTQRSDDPSPFFVAAGPGDQQIARLGARYLLEARRDDALPADPVARFHLGNGAKIEQLHVGADGSATGVSNSFGLMVSYRYDLADIETNKERYRNRGPVAATSAVTRLAGWSGYRRSA